MQSQRMVAAALLAAGLFLIALWIPLLGQVIGFFAPVPLMIIYVQEGRRAGLLSVALSTLMIFAVAGWQDAGIYVFSFGLMAVGLSEGMAAGLKHERSVLIGGGLPVAVLALVVASLVMRSGVNPVVAAEQYLKASIAEAAKLYTTLGFREAAEAANALSDVVVHYLVRLAPSLMISAILAQAACCYGAARVFLAKKTGIPSDLRQSFAGWHAPDAWVWGLIGSLVLLVVPARPLPLIGWNGLILFFTLYLAQGLAVLEYALKKLSVPAFGRGLIVVVVLAMPIVMLVPALGIIDIWADFRKVRAGAHADTAAPKE